MTRKDLPALVFLALAVALFFHEAAFLQRALFYHDLSLQHYPRRHFFAEQWKQGHYPLWCPQHLGGFPLFAEGQVGAAYPFNLLLYSCLKTWVALNLSAVLHLVFAAAGMFFLLRLWTGRFPAALAGLAYALSGWMVCHLIHLSAIHAAAWIPWAFYFLERTFRDGRAWSLALAALSLAMQFLAGYSPLALYSSLALALYFVFRIVVGWRQPHQAPAFRCILAAVILFGLAFGAAGVQLLPSWELLQNSDRQTPRTYEFLTYGSFPPPLAALFFMPRFFGSRGNDTHWHDLSSLPLHEMNFYLGLLPLFLAFFALARRRDAPTLFFALLLGLSGLFMLGKHTPFYPIHELMPVFDRMRAPARYAYLFLFGLAALAGLGLDQMIRDASTPQAGAPDSRGAAAAARRRLLIPYLACAIFLPLGLGLWIYKDLSASLTAQGLRLRQELFADAIRTLVFLVASAALIVFFPRKILPKRSLYLSAILGVSFLDLWSAGRDLNPTIEPSYYEDAPKTARWLQEASKAAITSQEAGADEQRAPSPRLPSPPPPSFFRIYDFDRSSDPAAAGWKFQWPYFELRERLNGCLPMAYGLSTLEGIPGLYLDRWWAFSSNITANRLGVMAVRYVVGVPPRDAEYFQEVSEGTPIPIYENLKAAPRAFLARDAWIIPHPFLFIQALESPEFQPRFTVLLEDPEAGAGEVSGSQPFDTEEASPDAPPDTSGAQVPAKSNPAPSTLLDDTVQFIDDEPDRVVLDVTARKSGYLVLADSDYPGWKATVDGRPTDIYRANFLARAIRVPSGRHQVEFVYRPLSFRFGVALTLGTVLFVGVGLILCRARPIFLLPAADTLLTSAVVSTALRYLAATAVFCLLFSLVFEWNLWAEAFAARF